MARAAPDTVSEPEFAAAADDAAEGGEQASLEMAEVEVTWSDSSGVKQSLLLSKVSLDWTLAALKEHCCEVLQTVPVHAQDYNEDMDSMSLLELGIGISGLPFAIILGPAAEHEAPSLGPAAAVVRASAGQARRSAAGSDKLPLKQRQAKADTSDVNGGWLFLGGNLAASNRAALQELGVTHIINCCDRIPCHFKKTFTYLPISVFDTKGSDIRKHFPEALDFIDRAHAQGGGCLVHCMVGASRSTSIVLAWLVSRCKIPLLQAFQDVRSRRGVARPNRSFCQQLMEFEEVTLGSRSAVLADFGHS